MYKRHPELIKKEIYDLNATDEEKDILYNFMKDYGGVLESQESAMLAVMIPEFTNYDVPHANKIRKIIAKKKMKEIASARKEYFETGAANGVSEDILKYIWDVQIKRQLGYSFSIPHTVAYSLIALQEMNLNLKFPPIYWATACLTVNSGGAEGTDGGTTNYGKLSSAIGRIKTQGITVELPNINIARVGFTPDAENNSIVYGLKGISEIGDDIISRIIANRPYTCFDDFVERIVPGKSQVIALIKAGCFDVLESEIGRKELMYRYLAQINPPKSRITLQNLSSLIRNNLIPNNKMGFVKLYNFCKYLKEFAKGDKLYLDDRAYKYFSDHFDIDILQHDKNGTYINKGVWEKMYSTKMDGMRTYFANHQEKLINALQQAEINSIWEDSCKGTLSSWEMEALGFYYHDHELTNCSHVEFDFVDFYEQPEIPVPDHYIKYKERDIPVYELVNICGTVLDKNSYKHTVTLLTPSGVVTVKCVAEQYSQYDKQISKLNKETGRKEVIERSWFKRGTKLIVSGWRNSDQFMARSRQSEEKHAFYKIKDIDDLGQLEITRYRAEE
jgi:DNA polymerase-3 subunit alpha